MIESDKFIYDENKPISDELIYQVLSHFTGAHQDRDSLYDVIYRRSSEFTAHTISKGVVSVPTIDNSASLAEKMACSLLVSDHAALRLPFSPNEHWVARRGQISTYDDVGDKWQIKLRFGSRETIETLLRKGKFLFRSGRISIIPEVDYSSDIGNDYSYDYARALRESSVQYTTRIGGKSPAKHLEELTLPLIQGLRLDDYLQLIEQEWDAFEECRLSFSQMAADLSKVSDDPISFRHAIHKAKRTILRHGVAAVEERYERLQRKGTLDAVKGILTSVPVVYAGLSVIGVPDFITNAASGAAGICNLLTAYFDFVSETKTLRGTPMYFLWRARDLE